MRINELVSILHLVRKKIPDKNKAIFVLSGILTYFMPSVFM